MSTNYIYPITLYTIEKFKHHNEIKDNLLNLIEKAENDNFVDMKEYYGDNITKLDWRDSSNMDREWVQYFLPFFSKYLSAEANQKRFFEVRLPKIWFQQYQKGGKHGWHVHGDNYAGVYYLDLPQEVPKTQLLLEDGRVITPEVEEGDILLFPSSLIHKAPENETDIQKTIISFNVNFDKPIPPSWDG